MILQGIMDVFYGIFCQLMTVVSIIDIPADIANGMVAVTGFGAWVCGADILVLTFAVVSGWFVLKLTVGLVLWLWDLLPFT